MANRWPKPGPEPIVIQSDRLSPEDWELIANRIDDADSLDNTELIALALDGQIDVRLLWRLLLIEGELNVQAERADWYKHGAQLAAEEIERLKRRPVNRHP